MFKYFSPTSLQIWATPLLSPPKCSVKFNEENTYFVFTESTMMCVAFALIQMIEIRHVNMPNMETYACF